MTQVIGNDLGPGGGIDTTTPNVARIYDYLLGGKDNFAVDRAAAQQLIASIPDVMAIARDGRAFLGRAVRYLAAGAGVRQFVDLGSGLPTRSNVHDLAQQVALDTRVVYVDNDPVVVSHGQALLASRDRAIMVHADLRKPASIMLHPDVLGMVDLAQPVALLCTSSLHFVPDEAGPHQIIAEYRDHLAPGSYLAITHANRVAAEEDPNGDVNSATSVYSRASAQLHARSLPEIRHFFDGFDLIDPGLVWMPEWRPDPGIAPSGRVRSLRGGVGRKA